MVPTIMLARTRDDGYVLLAGNSFGRQVPESVLRNLSSCELPETKLVVLGLQIPDDDQISSYDGGQSSDDTVLADLYARASLI